MRLEYLGGLLCPCALGHPILAVDQAEDLDALLGRNIDAVVLLFDQTPVVDEDSYVGRSEADRPEEDGGDGGHLGIGLG